MQVNRIKTIAEVDEEFEERSSMWGGNSEYSNLLSKGENESMFEETKREGGSGYVGVFGNGGGQSGNLLTIVDNSPVFKKGTGLINRQHYSQMPINSNNEL